MPIVGGREMSMPRACGKYIEVEPGVDIYYEERGQGPCILIVPGWTFTTEVFAQQLEYFSTTHRVIVFDPRSQGRSTVTLRGNDYLTHARDLGKIIDALELRNILLVGWSFGALTTWGYVREQGIGNLKCHVCIDLSPTPFSSSAEDWTEGSLSEIAEVFPMLRTPKGQREYVANYAEQFMVQRKLKDEELIWLVEQSAKSPPWVATLLYASAVFSNCMAEAKFLDDKRPALFILAEHWANIAKAFLRRNFPNTQVAVLGGHMMFWEYPQQFNKILENFLSSVKTEA